MGTRYNHLAEAVLTSTHNLCFEQKYEKYQSFFFFQNFQFLAVKFSIYLNRHVFVMHAYILATPGKLSQVPPRRYRLNGCDRYPELPVMVKN